MENNRIYSLDELEEILSSEIVVDDDNNEPKAIKVKTSKEIVQETTAYFLRPVTTSMTIEQIKPTDIALREVVSAYNGISAENSTYPTVHPETTLEELVEYIKQITPEQQVKIIYTFLYYSGRISDVLIHDKKLSQFKSSFMVYGGAAIVVMTIGVIFAVIIIGTLRNQIDANVFTQWLIDIFSIFSKILLDDVPSVD